MSMDEIRATSDQLAELALLRPSWESPGDFRPVSPEAGLRALLQRRQSELVRQQQQIAEAQAAIAGLVSEYADHRPWGRTGTDSLLGMDEVQATVRHRSASS
ncbi:hypothetical protein [Microbispora sp. NPDC049633]|uniref:hypothetical protein n=1 Tax=Microbispora sp. NPDC049633 TaxID=3154355 RepID=UPI003449B9E8